MHRSGIGAVLTALLLPLAAAAEPTSLLAIHPSSPWTLRDLEALGASLVSYDPDTGIAWVVANGKEEARLVAHGFAVATALPDAESGLRALAGDPDLGAYHTFDEMRAEIDALAASHPALAQREVLGRSGEGRDIVALKISDDPALDDPTEPDVLIVGCHHAREFMSVEVPLFVARTLLERAAQDARVARIVSEREIWIVPMLNPDGHVYQEQYQASPEWQPPGWRKNRTPNLDGSFGVDPNRNYSFEWGHDDEGSSPDGTSDIYRGTAPFSEPENRALRALVERQRFTIALSYHSFGKLLLYPWGFEHAFTEDHLAFAALADSMVRDNGYRPGNPALGTIYITNGELDDWLYGEITTRKPQRTFGFTVEMNLGQEGGFWPPESLIAPTCATLLTLNLFALEVAANVRQPLAPVPPVLIASQEPSDGRVIHLQWTQPPDAGNPVHHYEVFEIDPTGIGDLAPHTALDTPGRAVLGVGLPVPRDGELVLQIDAVLENLWDYAYVEVRVDDGRWRAQRGDATRTLSPTGRNEGHGLTGGIVGRTLRFQLDAAARAATSLDLAIRFDPHPQSPQHGFVRARFDVPATYGERRRIVDPNVRGTRYDVVAPRAGIFAYGVSAVDAEGQQADSEVFFFVIPTVDVSLTDITLEVEGTQLALSATVASDGAARLVAWTRPENRMPARDAATEWSRGDFDRVAEAAVVPGRQQLVWESRPGRVVVLLEASDAAGTRLLGPWTAAIAGRTQLHRPAPQPFRPGGAIHFELAVRGPTRVDVLRADGRRVRSLLGATRDAGTHAIHWDGRDDTGRQVAAGVYLVRLQAGAEARVQRLVLVR